MSSLFEYYAGECPICLRPMFQFADSVDRHHFVPKSQGGRATELVHRVCHRKIHSLWTEKECARLFSDPAVVRAHPDMQPFLAWISKKDPLFNDRSISSRRKRGM